jgi:expansin (peptidoglycan-binding protein)
MLVTKYLVIDVIPPAIPNVIGTFDTITDAGACITRTAASLGGRLILQPITVENAVSVFNHSGAPVGGKYTATCGAHRLTRGGTWATFDPTQPPAPDHTFDAQLKVIDAVVASLRTVTVTVRETMTGDPITLHYKDGLPTANRN